MRRRQVALVGRGLDLVEGQEAEDLPVLPDGILVDGEHVTAVPLYLLGEGQHRRRRRVIVGENAALPHGPGLCPMPGGR